MKRGVDVTTAKLTSHNEHTYFINITLEFSAYFVLLNGINNKYVIYRVSTND